MKRNPLLELEAFGQSIWLDYIDRHLLESGALGRLIEEDGLSGLTSNPAIFDEAIEGSHYYDNAIRAFQQEGKSAEEIYETLVIEDIRDAADLFRPLYERLEGRDGFVSIEVNPGLARDAGASITEARRLWAEVDRPNVMIKIPGTVEGLQALRRLTNDGINVNVTLLFGFSRYRRVADAYMAGLEERAARGFPIDRVASVASFFLSRIDVAVDRMLEEMIEKGGIEATHAGRLHGEAAVSCAKRIYQLYREVFGGVRFAKLAALGARTQRPLWASTGVKNPLYPEVKYVEALIGPETVNTLPRKTLAAYRDHGNPAPRLEEDLDRAGTNLELLWDLGIDLDALVSKLEDEGIRKFEKPYDHLIANLEKRQAPASA